MSLLNASAPHFDLIDSEKKNVSLNDFKNKNVVLAFFPLAFTSVCTEELCHFRDNLKSYEVLNTQVLGISIDSPFVLEVFKAQQNLNFPLLSDFNKEVATAYKVLYDIFPAFGLKGVSKRAVFVLNTEHQVIYEEICSSPGDMPNMESIQSVLQ